MTVSKLLFSSFISLLFPALLFSQQSIDFGRVNEKSNSTQKIKYNTTKYTYETEDSIDIYFTLMGGQWINGSVNLPSQVRVAKIDSGDVTVEFKPSQNVRHSGIVLVESKYSVEEIVSFNGQGIFSNAYYSSTRNKSEEDLKSALKTLLNNGTVSLGYNSARDNMYATIDNDGGQVECVYTGKKATFNTRSGANNSNFNCEHTYPQGFFSSVDPEKSDIHHLFPTTTTSNSRRGNDPFGIVSSVSWQDGGSKSGAGKFEPRDVHKGAVARSMMYFVLRHEDFIDNGTPFLSKQESVLRSWHNQYAVSQKEIDRNNAIFSLQKNRSPLVDYPQLLERITKVSGTSTPSAKYELLLSRNIRNLTVDTLEEGQGDLFQGIIYNAGNQTVTIDTITNKNNSSIKIEPSKRTLAPGEYCSFKFSVKIGVDGGYWAFNETFVINTNSVGQEKIEFTYTGVYNSPGSVGENLISRINVYPNPAKNVISFEAIDQGANFTYSIIDALGKEAMNGGLTQNQIEINTLNPGPYTVLLLENGQPAFQSRFVKD